MDRRKLGATGLEVPVIGMGTWKTFNVSSPGEEAARVVIVRTALENGANFFDSSPMYGEAERVLGAAVQQLQARQECMVATKVWTASDDASERQLRAALGYFGGYVDLYQVHNLVAWETRLGQLERLKAEGRVKAIGFTHWQHSSFGEMARVMQTGRVETIQIPYNALDREVEANLLPLAAALNIGVLVMRPFGEGDLLQKPPKPALLTAYEQFGVFSWPQILLKWIASDPRISVIIPATSRPERMAENAAVGNPPWFDQDTRKRIARLAAM